MKFRTIALFLFLAGLLAFAFYNTDWFKPKVMRISYRQMRDQGTVFLLDQSYRLNDIKVMKTAEVDKAKPELLWHMIGTTNTPSVTDFAYGSPIPGMQYFADNRKVPVLEPNEKYRVIVRSGKLTGWKDFRLEAKTNAPARPTS